MEPTPYNREVLVNVLVYHRPNEDSSCLCGWAELGRLHPVHVAEVYEEKVASVKQSKDLLPGTRIRNRFTGDVVVIQQRKSPEAVIPGWWLEGDMGIADCVIDSPESHWDVLDG